MFLSYYGVDVRRPRRRCNPVAGRKVVGMVAYMYAPKLHLGQRRGLKGHEDLIDALQLCRREMPNLLGVFVGGAWNGARWYEDRVMRYGRARDPQRNVFLGTRTDVDDLYDTFDVAVCPSHSENVGAAVESLLLGVPTVATNVGGLPDLVKNHDTGWLVPPRRPDALARAILDALTHGRKAANRARSGQRLARKMFDVTTTAAGILTIYTKVLLESCADRHPASPQYADRGVA